MDRISKLERAKKRLSPAQIRTLFANLAEPFVPGLNAVREGMAGNYGTAAVSGLLDVGGPIGKGVGIAAAPLMGAIRVFHGSPHKFDKFDMSKIGTGEGAQAYGHGLYFAENPQVAKDYAKMRLRPNYKPSSMQESIALDRWNTVDKLEKAKAKGKTPFGDEWNSDWDKRLDFAKQEMAKSFDEAPSNLYEVNLRWPGAREATDPLGPQHFLDYYKPLSEQSKFVQDALAKIGYSVDKTKVSQYDDALLSALSGKDVLVPKEPFNPSGERIINILTNTFGDKVAASERLRNAGIPGVRYLDAMSRGQGGTSNYVTFNDQLAEILRRNPGLLE
jgi:hypothetical protein